MNPDLDFVSFFEQKKPTNLYRDENEDSKALLCHSDPKEESLLTMQFEKRDASLPQHDTKNCFVIPRAKRNLY